MTLQIPLSEPLDSFVQEQVARGGFAAADEYVLALICEDRRRKSEAELQALILEGLAGPRVEMTPEDWAGIRSEVQERLARRVEP